jgi:hypothetical protein
MAVPADLVFGKRPLRPAVVCEFPATQCLNHE